jgi:uncharacterized protein (DUF1800 family)
MVPPDPDGFSKIKHLYARAGFSLSARYHHAVEKNALKKQIDILFANADKIALLNLPEITSFDRQSYKALDPEEKKNYDKKEREQIRMLNLKWLEQMEDESQQLREKMTLFWHGHFACSNNHACFVQQQNNTLRKGALGKFGALLRAIAKDPAMLDFLNNRQNKKAHPNENFAREVMELFSLGIGNYTEQDIKEAARAFTGWSFDDNGQFQVNDKQHDSGTKKIFGKEATFDGDAVIDLLLEKKETAAFIVRKIYRFFVNDAVNEEHVKTLSESFYKSDYDISQLMHTIFSAEWFYEPVNRGCKIKSPVELLVGMVRQLDAKVLNPEPFFKIQKLLGQVLFYPPNVAGWPGGKTWIDSSTLMIRLNLIDTLMRSEKVTVKEKQELGADLMMTAANENMVRKQDAPLKTEINWIALQERFPKEAKPENLIVNCAQFFLPKDLPASSLKSTIEAMTSQDPEPLKKCIALMLRLPEYQTC